MVDVGRIFKLHGFYDWIGWGAKKKDDTFCQLHATTACEHFEHIGISHTPYIVKNKLECVFSTTKIKF